MWENLERRIRVGRGSLEGILRYERRSEGFEHARLREFLARLAIENGYTHMFQLFPGAAGRIAEPDVARQRDDRVLFVGEAREDETESIEHEAATERIHGHYRQWERVLLDSRVNGVFAIATNTKDSAQGWAKLLTLLGTFAVLRAQDGVRSYAYERMADDTWLVY